jgi:hypothetical protein
MAASIAVEEERGTLTRSPYHPHNGYYAGDFGSYPADRPVTSFAVAGGVRS